MKFIKRIILVVLFLFLAETTFGQQNLWTTSKVRSDSTGIKYVPLENVTKEVITFYDQYDYYYDFSGYSKSRFIEEFNYGFTDWSWINKISELTVYAMKSNTGNGSLVLVVCVSRTNLNLLIFSNDIALGVNPQYTGSYEKDKFAKWFKTLLN